jgi:folate-binding protein YgfZ
MSTTDFTERLATPLRTSDYRGTPAAAVYSGARQEFDALLHGCGISELSWRAKLAVTGRDRVRWLNGMVTNNIRDLAQGRGVYAFLLNPQGHILGDLYAYHRGESLLLDTDRSQLEKLSSSLKRYIIMDKVELSTPTDLSSISVIGPKSLEILSRIGASLPELEPLQLVEIELLGIPVTVVRQDTPGVESYELWLNPGEVPRLWKALLETGATAAGTEAFEMLRVAAGIPVYGQDIRERDLPQETAQERALNFSKGCYIGQEIVERIRSRGAVHRNFSGLRIDGAVPVPGTKIQSDNKEVGEITSSTSLPLSDGAAVIALGYVRREAGGEGKQVQVAGSRATLATLPFAELLDPATGKP